VSCFRRLAPKQNWGCQQWSQKFEAWKGFLNVRHLIFQIFLGINSEPTSPQTLRFFSISLFPLLCLVFNYLSFIALTLGLKSWHSMPSAHRKISWYKIEHPSSERAKKNYKDFKFSYQCFSNFLSKSLGLP